MLWEDFEFRPGPVISRDAAEALNRLWMEVRRLGQMSVTAGLSLDSNEGGVALGVVPETLNLPPSASNCCPCPVYQFTLSGLSPGCGGNGAYSLPFAGTPDQCVWSGNGADGSSATLVMIGGSGALSITTIGGCQAIYTLVSGSCGQFNATLAFASSPSGWPFSLVISCGFTTPSPQPGTSCCQCQVYQVVVSGSPGIGGGTYFLTFQTPCIWTQALFDGSVGLVLTPGADGSAATLTLATNGGIAIFTGVASPCNGFTLSGGASQTATVTCATPGVPTPPPPGGGGGFQPPGSCWSCPPYTLPPMADVRCEQISPGAGGIPGHSVITVYTRNVRVGWVNCCPVILSIGPWAFSHTAGCCDCLNVPGPLCCQCSQYNLTISGVSPGCDANDTYALFFTGPGCVWQGQGATFGGLAVLTMSDAAAGTAQLVITTPGGCQATYTGSVGNCNSFTLSLLGTPTGTGWPSTVTLTCAPVSTPGSGTGSCTVAVCQYCGGSQCDGTNNAPYQWTVTISASKPFGGVCGVLLGTTWTLGYVSECTWSQLQTIGNFLITMILRIDGPKDAVLKIQIQDANNLDVLGSAIYHSLQPIGGNCCVTFDFSLDSDADCNCQPLGGGGGISCQNCPEPPGSPSTVTYTGSGFTGQFAPLNQTFVMKHIAFGSSSCGYGSGVQFDPASGGFAQAQFFFSQDPAGALTDPDFTLFLSVTNVSGGVICWLQYYSADVDAGDPDDCCHIPTLINNEAGSPACSGTFPISAKPVANCGGDGGDGGGSSTCALALGAVPACCCSGSGSGSGIGTGCCPGNPLTTTLVCTFTGCLAQSVTLTWNGVAWVYDDGRLSVGLQCIKTGPSSFQWSLDVSCPKDVSRYYVGASPTSATCSPFLLTFATGNQTDPRACCTGSFGASISQ